MRRSLSLKPTSTYRPDGCSAMLYASSANSLYSSMLLQEEGEDVRSCCTQTREANREQGREESAEQSINQNIFVSA